MLVSNEGTMLREDFYIVQPDVTLDYIMIILALHVCADVPAHVGMCVWRPGSSAFTSEPSALLFDTVI